METLVGNNGNALVDRLHFEELLKDGQTMEEIEEIARPFMLNERHLTRDSFWENVQSRAEELGYKLSI